MSGSKNSFTPALGASEGLLHGPRLASEVRLLARSPGRSEEEIDLLGSVALALEATPRTVRVAAQAAVAAYDKGDDVWGGIEQLRRALIDEPQLGAACDEETASPLDAVRQWLEHDAECAAFFEPTAPCSCGLAEAMAAHTLEECAAKYRHPVSRQAEPALGWKAEDDHWLVAKAKREGLIADGVVWQDPGEGGRLMAEHLARLSGLPVRIRSGPPRFYDSLRVVLGRPDVGEAIAKGLCAHNGGNWEAATEGGRNAFREEAGKLIAEALAAPRESKLAREPAAPHRCRGCDEPKDEQVNLPEGWREGDPMPADITTHTNEDGSRFAFRGHPLRQDRVPLK